MSIADKLTTIAENTPKVYDAGYKKAVETVCPPINETGKLVQCYPLDGYPLTVNCLFVGTLELTVCGKNLYNKTKYPLNTDGYPYSGTSNQGMLTNSQNYKRTDFIPVAHLVGQTITLSHPPSGTNPGISFYKYLPNATNSADCKTAWCGGTTGATIKVPDNAMYMVFCVKKEDADADVQIELGSVATSYEPYVGIIEYCDNLDDMPMVVDAIKGINTVFAFDDGGSNEYVEISVTGIADPKAEIDKLKAYVGALSITSV